MLQINELVAQWYGDGLREAVNHCGQDTIAQVEQAVDALPDLLGEAPGTREEAIDEWFVAYLRQPPVAYDTELYNRLYAAKEDLKARIAAAH